MTAVDPRFPVGEYQRRTHLTSEDRQTFIRTIAEMPARMREAVAGLSDEQLDTPYREGGWSIRQVVHHVPDSHLNAYSRVKMALTEDSPTIKPYDEAAWAKLADSRTTPVEVSLTLLEALHARWDEVWRSMSDADFARTMNHPERGIISLDDILGLYEWHSRHHVAHITSLRERMRW